MKTLNFLRALFFRDVRTLFRSVLAAELGTILLWCFLVISQGKEQLPFVALLIPALSVPLLLMKRDGGERMFPYPLWTVVLGKYLLGGVSFLGIAGGGEAPALQQCYGEKIVSFLCADGGVGAAMLFPGGLCILWPRKERTEYDSGYGVGSVCPVWQRLDHGAVLRSHCSASWNDSGCYGAGHVRLFSAVRALV